METTKFIDDPSRGPLLKSQAVIYGLTALASVGLLVLGSVQWWQHRHDSQAPADPHSLGAGLSELFSVWKREIWHPTPTATPAPAIQPAQAATAQAVTATPTPYQPTDEQMAEWQHVPPGQEQHYAEYQQRLNAQHPTPVPTPFPTPYLLPEVAATPDPVAVRYNEWKTMRDAYAKQQLVRAQHATTDAERGQIQADVARWRANNPEPPKPKSTPNEGEIPIR